MDYPLVTVPVKKCLCLNKATRYYGLFKAVINCFNKEAYLAEVGHEILGLEECLKFGKCGNSVTPPGGFKLLWFKKISVNVI